MGIANSSLIDFQAFLTQQKAERYRAFLVHDLPREGKTAFAHHLAALCEQAVYLDVLQYIAMEPELARRVDTLDIPRFQSLILSVAAHRHAHLLLVDEFDFLLPIWGESLPAFFHMVEKLSNRQTDAIIGFFLQTHPMMEHWSLFNNARQPRILTLKDIQPLPNALRDKEKEAQDE